MVVGDDLILGGGHTIQYMDNIIKIYTRKLYNPVNKRHPNKFFFK